jgi:ATP-dependent DNA helicase PIF1
MSSLLPDLLASRHVDLNDEQQEALRLLNGDDNVFITGGAGTGKSFLLRKFLQDTDPAKLPVLASTGAAAVLIGGRTFHSFFGLGIMEGGIEATIERAAKDRRVARRLKKAAGFVLDEVSMIPGVALDAAERIACRARGDMSPWGGLKVVAVGDFAQLPPVTRDSNRRDWAFLSPAWERSKFKSVHLRQMMRAAEDPEFCQILADVRVGLVSDRVKHMLDWRSALESDDEFEGSVLYARKIDVDRINQHKLSLLEGDTKTFETEFSGDERAVKSLQNNLPIPHTLELKPGAFVMLRQNDPQGRWVNGSLGHVKRFGRTDIEIKLSTGRSVELERSKFSLLDAEGNETATARNYPLSLAYAVTIHKAQGATLDKMIVSLRNLWEPGQAYVALSRVRSSQGLSIDGWDARSIFADPQVTAFHARIANNS